MRAYPLPSTDAAPSQIHQQEVSQLKQLLDEDKSSEKYDSPTRHTQVLSAPQSTQISPDKIIIIGGKMTENSQTNQKAKTLV